MANIFEDPTECKERGEMVVSSTCVPADNAKRVRMSKVDPYAPSNSIEHVERPRYGQAY